MVMITEKHIRSVVGWDITVMASGNAGERIRRVRVRINGSPEPDERVSPPAASWSKVYPQRGIYPGTNKLQVGVEDDSGSQTPFESQWG